MNSASDRLEERERSTNELFALMRSLALSLGTLQ